MTTLRRRFADDIKAATEARDNCRVATLRLVLATLKDRDTAARGNGGDGEIGDAEILDMLARMVRQRCDSVADYRADGRPDLAAREAEEIGHLEHYLPRRLDESETMRAIAEAIAETGAESLKDIGRAMTALKRRYAGRMDFAAANRLMKIRLAGGA